MWFFGKKKKEKKVEEKEETKQKVNAKEEKSKTSQTNNVEKKQTKEEKTEKKQEKPVETTTSSKNEKPNEADTQTENSKQKKTVYRVLFDKEDKLWKIKKDGAKRVIDSKKTKEEALARVQELSKSQDTKFVVYKKDGKFQKKANLKLKNNDEE